MEKSISSLALTSSHKRFEKGKMSYYNASPLSGCRCAVHTSYLVARVLFLVDTIVKPSPFDTNVTKVRTRSHPGTVNLEYSGSDNLTDLEQQHIITAVACSNLGTDR